LVKQADRRRSGRGFIQRSRAGCRRQDAARDSLRQHGGRPEARRALRQRRLVCPPGVDLSAFRERGWL